MAEPIDIVLGEILRKRGEPEDGRLARWVADRLSSEGLAPALMDRKLLSQEELRAADLFEDWRIELRSDEVHVRGCRLSDVRISDLGIGFAGSDLRSGMVLPGFVRQDHPLHRGWPQRLLESLKDRDSAPVAAPVEERDGMVGRLLGRYRLLAAVGRGAKGTVYAAEDTLLGRRAAVKVLSPELVLSGDKSLKRFLREARTASRLDHPNCVGVYSVDKQDGLVYYAMPLVVGRSVQDLLDAEKEISVAEATRIAGAAARGLAHAHSQGVVHRDVKPGNILLGSGGEVRMADFGMAKVTDEAISGLTEPGRWLGTPHYMSPEQCRGDHVDARADVYSLAATYFALLTGRPPFADFGPSAVVYKQVEAPHPDPREFRSDIPAGCVAIINKGMAKKPEDRYASASEMAEALGGLLAAPDREDSKTQVPARPTAIDASVPSVGNTLGRCLLIEQVGTGASGMVFRALHRSLNVPVAVKVLKPDGVNGAPERFRELFTGEAHVLARMDHPNIVRVLDFEDSGAYPYLVLEYVDGLTLRDLIRQSGVLRPNRAIDVVTQVAFALEYARERGIIHRDIKPANILISKTGAAKVADMGLARLTGRTEGSETVVGTPAYMAPEQAAGTPDIDHRADIFALGITLHQALTGRLPERRDGAVVVEPALDRGLGDALGRMTAKRREERFSDYFELTDVLTGLRRTMRAGEGEGAENPGSSHVGRSKGGWRSLFSFFRRGSDSERSG